MIELINMINISINPSVLFNANLFVEFCLFTCIIPLESNALQCEKNNKMIHRTFSRINLTNFSIHFIFIIVSNVNRTIRVQDD